MEEIHKKNKIDTMRFTDIDINFDVTYEGHQNCPKILSMNILSVFSDHHLWRQNWCQYLWTSLCQFNFFVNLLHSLGVSFFDIWHLFDNLTSFWQLDIFLIFWEQITHGPPFPMWLIPLYPIAHVSHCPHGPYPLYPMCPYCPCAPYPCTLYPQWASLPMCPIPLYPIAHVTDCLCGPYPCATLPIDPIPLYPIPLVPHTLCGTIAYVPLLPMCPIPLVPPLPIGSMAHVAYTPCTPYPMYTIAPLPITCPPLGNGPCG